MTLVKYGYPKEECIKHVKKVQIPFWEWEEYSYLN